MKRDRGGAMDESTETAHIYVNAREPSVLCVYTSSNALCFTNTVLANTPYVVHHRGHLCL